MRHLTFYIDRTLRGSAPKNYSTRLPSHIVCVIECVNVSPISLSLSLSLPSSLPVSAAAATNRKKNYSSQSVSQHKLAFLACYAIAPSRHRLFPKSFAPISHLSLLLAGLVRSFTRLLSRCWHSIYLVLLAVVCMFVFENWVENIK